MLTKPGVHRHTNDPGVLWQRARGWHGSVRATHSSTSLHQEPFPVKPRGQWHEKEPRVFQHRAEVWHGESTHSSVSTHACFSSWYPDGQEQLYAPGRLVHTWSKLQVVLSLHSSISSQPALMGLYPGEHWQEKDPAVLLHNACSGQGAPFGSLHSSTS